jgi:uracil-DNA glycosylase
MDPAHDGRAFLCVENDDATAERLCGLLQQGGIDVSVTLPWNAYPWYINRKPNAAELRAGVDPLRRLLALLTRLEVVLLLGGEAQAAWRLLSAAHPEAVDGLTVLESRHTGKQAFIGSSAPRLDG